MFKLILIYVLLLTSEYSLGCLVEKKPSENFDEYESIYLGQVVGVHLNAYQDSMVKGLRKDDDFTFMSSTTPEYTVTVLPRRLHKGHASEVETLKISGCDVSMPALLSRGLFFIQPDKEVFVLYDTDYYDYEDFYGKASAYYLNQKQKLKIQRNTVSRGEHP
ncbi:hypothetical protein OS175_04505 [Marinicella sp. S1101]|uniref:hypothetical protein n=1 Tax=Marinicella marina TaxID=2996016 RepID=UPI002260AFC6|nr:hypothetical protein [Marinicella marina]MCX7553128.1 hypothetical protein [Marinicella marina]MDJ1138860.1 hypothetical protein [Marinicella marina]